MLSMSQKKSPKAWIGIPPWVILGAVLVLVPIFVLMTIENLHRQKENTTRLMVEKGAALIRSFEAGARTGMMGMHWGGFQVQSLLTETAQQPDIAYLLVTDVKGTILAHSDISRIGQRYGSGLDLQRISRSKKAEWRQVSREKGSRVFEVFRQFSPTQGHAERFRCKIRPNDWCWPHMGTEGRSPNDGQIIFVGLDMGPIESSREADARHTVVMALILLMIGFAGIVSLFLAQAYRSARSSLSEVEAFSDKLVENMPVGLLAVDVNGRIASFNQTAESVLGISAADILGQKADDVLPRQLLSVADRLNSRGGIIGREIDCPGKDSALIPLDVITTSLHDKGGAFMGHLILLRDLTEIRALKREIERSERLASIGSLAAGIAHEIRNPLSSIKGFATYFKERYSDVPEDRETAQVMVQEVERLNRVIGQLLEFARPLSLRKRATSLPALVQHSLKMIEGDVHRKNINIETKITPNIKDILVDPDKITQVLLNIYLNALEAMEDGGTLSVDVGMDYNTENTRITISDTGPGINEEDLARIFDPYFTTKSSGTGLGLAIVHNIVDAHKGDIRVQSRLGIGTSVTITLPYSIEV